MEKVWAVHKILPHEVGIVADKCGLWMGSNPNPAINVFNA